MTDENLKVMWITDISSEHDYNAPNYKYLLSSMLSSDESAHFMIYNPVATKYPCYLGSPFISPALVTDTFRQIAESRDSTLGAALCARAALGSAIYLNYNCKACGRKNDPLPPSLGIKNEPLTPSRGLISGAKLSQNNGIFSLNVRKYKVAE